MKIQQHFYLFERRKIKKNNRILCYQKGRKFEKKKIFDLQKEKIEKKTNYFFS